MFGVCGIQQVSHRGCGVTCVPGGLGCHPVLAFLPMRSPEMPSDVLSWPPQAKLRLPFALHPPRFDQGLCLGFPAEQALDRQAAGDVVVREPLFFSSEPVSCLGRAAEEGGERMHVPQGHCVYYYLTVSTQSRPSQAVTPGW